MRLVTKVLSLLFLAGSSTATYLLVSKFNNNDINSSDIKVEDKSELSKDRTTPTWQQELVKEGYTLVSKNDSWQTFPGLAEAYSEEKTIPFGEADNKLSELCDKFREQEQLSPEEQKETKRWCVQPRTLDSLLQQKGKKLLYQAEERGFVWDSAKVNKKIEDYSKNQDEKLKLEVSWENNSKLNIGSSFSPKDKENFQNACLDLLAVKSFDKDLERRMEKAEKWCVD
ncbi:hypothetical protein A6V39_04680 [Candidatus Mycoplasma haematobovis]|uniref:Uncharacterized protein n=1 Tax=Candidatus Mycoplasma haematobovis TaxID=432608 RepID=A0A1A9QD00_9MOLU|nr:hypothetical protein [Candidatus Mycoplasma haematobovis]OAL09846.1 hypothetical protein A6V39_04680 [Candidatus Mycoplasma haematobovis]